MTSEGFANPIGDSSVDLTALHISTQQQQLYATLADIAERVPISHWCVIGGIMTEVLLAQRNFTFAPSTGDIDLVGDIFAFPRALRQLASAAQTMDYNLQTTGWGAEIGTRFFNEQLNCFIDIMAPANTSHRRDVTTAAGKQAMEAVGSDFALTTAQPMRIRFAEGAPETVCRVPSYLGAIYCKATAIRRAGESTHQKHLRDAARLVLASTDADLRSTPRSGIKRFRWLRTALSGLPRPEDIRLTSAQLEFAIATLDKAINNLGTAQKKSMTEHTLEES